MKKNEIVVVFSSHLSEEENQKFITHIQYTIGIKNFNVICYSNFNEFSLAEIYNKAIKEYNKPNTIMVFCHNDIQIKTKNWGRLLLTKFNNFDYQIIGVAGTKYLADNGIWWHKQNEMVGIVEHTDGYSQWVSTYSKHKPGRITPVILIDGVFMAMDISELKHTFDESFKGFHFYDLPICLENYLDGYNIGVTTDIRILHKSVGMVNEEWEKNRKLFINKYKKELPFSINKYLQ